MTKRFCDLQWHDIHTKLQNNRSALNVIKGDTAFPPSPPHPAHAVTINLKSYLSLESYKRRLNIVRGTETATRLSL